MQLADRPRTTAGAKQLALHHWMTAGVAVAGVAGVIAVAPGVTPVLPRLQHELQASAVRLTAGWDPLTAWQNAFNTASGNASTLADNFLLAPGVGLQQAIVNEVGFLKEVLNDPSSIGTVLTQFATNAQTVASGLTGLNASAATNKAAQAHSIDALHGALLGFLPSFLPAGIDAATVTQVLNVLASPLSGLVIGAAGPIISPGVALLNSVLAVGAALQASDPSAALSALLDAPANAVNAFFNGADLNLDALVPLIASAGILPAGTTISALDVAFGGLLSVGSVSQGTYTQNGTIDPITTPGGSILNSLGLTVTTDALGAPLTLNIASHAVGPLGALESISQTVGVLLGDHWDGKHAVQTPPLSTLSDTADTAAVNAALTVKAPTTASIAALPTAGTTVALTTAPATKAIEAAAPKDATDTSAVATDSSATGTSATDATTESSTSSTDATDSSTSSAASSTGDTTTKGDPADSTAASGSSSTGDTSTKGDAGTKSGGDTKGDTGTKSGGDAKGGSNAKGDGGAKKSGDTGSKSGSDSKGSGGGGRHRK